MYDIGELVVYGTYGVCEVSNIGSLDLPMIDKSKKYYTLTPYYKREDVVYASVENDSTIMRSVITEKAARELIKQIPEIEETQVASEKEREQTYKTTVRTCDVNKLVGIIKTISRRKNERLESGKKVTVLDERYLKQASEQLYGELAIALNMDKADVEDFIFATQG